MWRMTTPSETAYLADTTKLVLDDTVLEVSRNPKILLLSTAEVL